MRGMSEDKTTQSQRTLLAALLLSAPGPLVTGIAAVTSRSSTQIADFLRRTTELVATFVSWWIYRKLQKDGQIDPNEQARLERIANLCIGATMICSGFMMLIVAMVRMRSYQPAGNSIMGLIIAVLGLITNSWFWLRYRALALAQGSAVIAGQQRLYRAKSGVDFCVVVALTAVTIAPAHPISRYIDIGGSAIVACYLFWNGLSMIKSQWSAAACRAR